jgi:hypothetical protein
VDNTGSGGQDVGSAVGRAVQTELVHSTELVGRALKLEGGVAPRMPPASVPRNTTSR